MERITEFEPAYDNTAKGGGLHGINIRFILRGEHGAVQFLIFTNWRPKQATKRLRAEMSPSNYFLFEPMPADVGYHSKVPRYEGQHAMENCVYVQTPDGKCYYDGSTLHAEQVYDILLEKGSEGVWEYLGKYYDSVFREHLLEESGTE